MNSHTTLVIIRSQRMKTNISVINSFKYWVLLNECRLFHKSSQKVKAISQNFLKNDFYVFNIRIET